MTRTEHVAIKGTRDGLILYIDPDADFGELIEELKKLLNKSVQFLKGASVRCYAGDKAFTEDEQARLKAVLEEQQLKLTGWMTKDEVEGRANSRSKANPVAENKETRLLEEKGTAEGNCLFAERTLRSGSSIQFDGHVILLGDVNPGAEIIAAGNIVVLGSLRGVAHAGAAGERNAIINAYHLAPTQLRIADLVTRGPEDEEDSRGPETARIKDGQLVVEAVEVTEWRGKLR